MKKNTFATKDEGQVGIGTMIVFIATILVAAVAAGVLIDTSQKLQDKSTRTGADAVENVGTSLQIEKVFGDTHGTTDGIEEFEVLAKLAAGAEPVDLEDLIITFSDGARLAAITYATNQEDGSLYTEIAPGQFYIDPVRDADLSLMDDGADDIFNNHDAAGDDDYASRGLLNADDVVMIRFTGIAAAGDLNIGNNVQVSLQLATGSGAITQVGFTTPASYADTEHFELA